MPVARHPRGTTTVGRDGKRVGGRFQPSRIAEDVTFVDTGMDIKPTTHTYLDSILDPDALNESIDAGLVRVGTGDGDLRIFNYSAQAAYAGIWTTETMTCRGLIVDGDNRVLARPFQKFFGLGEPLAGGVPVDAPIVVTEKLDGSLGIAYRHPSGHVRIATRGSLKGQQAVEATRIWHSKYRDVTFPEGCTPLFEIIYPENRIVVDYAETRDLVLLAVIDVASGSDLPLDVFDWTGPVAETYEFPSFAELVEHVEADQDGITAEGYVARFGATCGIADAPHQRIKLKFPSYVALHRAVFGLTPRRVWEALSVADCINHGSDPRTLVSLLGMSPQKIDEIMATGDEPTEALRALIPEESHPWFDQTVASLRSDVEQMMNQYSELTAIAREESAGDRKAFALSAQRLAKEHGVPPAPMFAIYTGKDVRAGCWRSSKPEHNKDDHSLSLHNATESP